MTISEMFGQSGILTLLGMGVVFAFLVILIVFMKTVAAFVRARGWDGGTEVRRASPAAENAAVNPAIIAAVTAAVTEYRKTTT